MIRFLFTVILLLAFVWFGSSVDLGRRTLFGHITNIWSSSEAKEMRDDVSKHTGPALDEAADRLKRGIEAMSRDGGKADDPALPQGDDDTGGAPAARINRGP